MSSFDQLASQDKVEKAVAALRDRGINALAVDSGEEAKKKILELLPKGAQVMTMSSESLGAISLLEELENSPELTLVKKMLQSMDRETERLKMQQLGAAPEWAIGSVQAVTENGEVLIASATGSQLAAYAYGAFSVVWVVGTQKIVRDLDEGTKRIYEYVLPLESERARRAYGVEGSEVNKLLIINKEFKKDRITLIFVNEPLGF